MAIVTPLKTTIRKIRVIPASRIPSERSSTRSSGAIPVSVTIALDTSRGAIVRRLPSAFFWRSSGRIGVRRSPVRSSTIVTWPRSQLAYRTAMRVR